jgi:hypothetical protein
MQDFLLLFSAFDQTAVFMVGLKMLKDFFSHFDAHNLTLPTFCNSIEIAKIPISQSTSGSINKFSIRKSQHYFDNPEIDICNQGFLGFWNEKLSS